MLESDRKLVEKACDACLNFKDRKRPFVPKIQLADGRRSVLPEDLEGEELCRLAEILPSLCDHYEAGRVADALWTCRFGGGKCIEYCKTAIEHYLQVPIDSAHWIARHGFVSYARAMNLAKGLGSQSPRFLQKISSEVQSALFSGTEPKMVYDYAEFLLDKDLPEVNGSRVIECLERRFCQPELTMFEISEYGKLLTDWVRRIKGEEAAGLVALRKATRIIKIVLHEGDAGDPAVITGQLEPLLKELGGMPQIFRKEHGVDATIKQIRSLLSSAYLRSTKTMQHFVSDPIDLTAEIRKWEQKMKGLDPNVAMQHLLAVPVFAYEHHCKRVEEIMAETPLLGIFPVRQIDEQGRPIAQEKGRMEDGAGDGRSYISRMVYVNTVKIAVKACLRPSHCVMKSEHPLSIEFFGEIVCQSRIVPDQRREVVAKGLFYGYRGDYETACYILIPQFEQILRELLKGKGIETRHLDSVVEKEGELSLSSLVERSEGVMPANFVFEIKTLFGKAPEMDLRNKFMHGNIGDCNHAEVVFYIWWFILREVYKGCL